MITATVVVHDARTYNGKNYREKDFSKETTAEEIIRWAKRIKNRVRNKVIVDDRGRITSYTF